MEMIIAVFSVLALGGVLFFMGKSGFTWDLKNDKKR